MDLNNYPSGPPSSQWEEKVREALHLPFTAAHIPLARMLSRGIASRKTGKCSLFPGWPYAQLKNGGVLLDKNKQTKKTKEKSERHGSDCLMGMAFPLRVIKSSGTIQR